MAEAENTSKNSRMDDLETLRMAILDEMLLEAAFDGWTDTSLRAAARSAGLGPEEIARGDLTRVYPRGIGDVLDFWSEHEDTRMATALEAADPAPEKIRDKVRFLVRTRIEGLGAHREAARRASATLAMPHYAPLASRLSWRTADAIWRALNDVSTDFNFYTKRATLTGVYLSTLAAWFADDGDELAEPDYSKTWDFLNDRIENVMQFEKVKKQWQDAMPDMEGLTEFLGRLRYGSGR